MKKYVKAAFDNDKDYIEWELDQLRNTINTRKNAETKKAEASDDIEIQSFSYGEADAFDQCLKDLGDFTRHLANHGMID